MNIRGILIDPFNKAVTEVEVESGDGAYESMRSHVFGDKDKGLLQAVGLGGGITLWIDEEGLLCDWDTQAFFKLKGNDEETDPFAGRGLLLMDDGQGGEASCPLPVDLVFESVSWVDPRNVVVQAPMFTTFNDDGTTTTVPLTGSDKWDYHNQP